MSGATRCERCWELEQERDDLKARCLRYAEREGKMHTRIAELREPMQTILDLAEARLRNSLLSPMVEHDLGEIVRLAKSCEP